MAISHNVLLALATAEPFGGWRVLANWVALRERPEDLVDQGASPLRLPTARGSGPASPRLRSV